MIEKLQILIDELILLFDTEQNSLKKKSSSNTSKTKPLQLWDQIVKEVYAQEKKYEKTFTRVMTECKRSIYVETFAAWEITGYNDRFSVLKKELVKLSALIAKCEKDKKESEIKK